MKKQTICLTALSLVLLTGCSGARADVQNRKDVLFTVGNTTVTKGDEYDLLKAGNGGAFTVELAQRAVYEQVVPVTDDIKKAAEEEYEELAESYTDLEEQLKNMGYETKDAYLEKVLIPSKQGDALKDQYFIDNKDEILSQYKPSIVKVLQCGTTSDAKEALEKLNDGKKMDDIYDDYSSEDSSFTSDEIVMSTLNSAPTRLINTAYEATEAGVLNEVFETEDEGNTYAYVVEVTKVGYDDNLDQIRSTLKADSSTLEDETWIYYFKKFDFKIYDQDVFNYLKVNKPAYLIDYPELSEEKDSE